MSISLALTRFRTIATKVQAFMNSFFLSFLVVLVTIQIILRYIFKSPLLGIEELMIFPTIWLYMLGGASASLEGKHIECGMLDSLIKNPKTLQMTVIIKNIISVGVCIILCRLCFDFFSYSLKTWKISGSLYIPMFFGESSLFICILLMTIYSIFSLVDSIIAYCDKTKGVM